MNMAAKSTETTNPDVSSSPVGDSKKAVGDSKKAPHLDKADIAILRKELGSGMNGYARQGDVIELLKRVNERFDNLPEALDKLGAGQPGELKDQHGELKDQLRTIEDSLNGLEGALRIELAPFLSSALREELNQTLSPKRSWRNEFLMTLALIAGVSIGTIWSDDILAQILHLRSLTGL